MNATHLSCFLAFNTTKSFAIPVYSVALVAGLPLNCLALWALRFQIKKHSVLSVYVLNVMLANLFQTLMLPFWISYSYHNHQWVLGHGACVVFGAIFFTNFYAKNNFLCLIATERYLGLVYPMKLHRFQTRHGATKVSIAAWLLVAILCVIDIWLQRRGSETWQGHCLDGYQLTKDYAQFKMVIMCFTFLMPCVLMGFFYFRVLHELRKMASLQQRVKRRVYGFISLIITSFFLLCIPYQVASCYKYYWAFKLEDDRICDFEKKCVIYIYITWCLAILDNIMDPLLYILLLKDVQLELKEHLRFKPCRIEITYKFEQQDLPLHPTAGQMQQQPASQ